MYRLLVCKITLLAMTSVLVACGQSGALMLPSDPNYDKRSQYLLHKNVEQQANPSQTPSANTSNSAQSTQN